MVVNKWLLINFPHTHRSTTSGGCVLVDLSSSYLLTIIQVWPLLPHRPTQLSTTSPMTRTAHTPRYGRVLVCAMTSFRRVPTTSPPSTSLATTAMSLMRSLTEAIQRLTVHVRNRNIVMCVHVHVMYYWNISCVCVCMWNTGRAYCEMQGKNCKYGDETFCFGRNHAVGLTSSFVLCVYITVVIVCVTQYIFL